MTITDRINAALIKYLKSVHKIDAIVAEFDEVMVDTYGCSCDSSTDLSFDIRYKLTDTQKSWGYQTIHGDVIDFLPELDAYED